MMYASLYFTLSTVRSRALCVHASAALHDSVVGGGRDVNMLQTSGGAFPIEVRRIVAGCALDDGLTLPPLLAVDHRDVHLLRPGRLY